MSPKRRIHPRKDLSRRGKTIASALLVVGVLLLIAVAALSVNSSMHSSSPAPNGLPETVIQNNASAPQAQSDLSGIATVADAGVKTAQPSASNEAAVAQTPNQTAEVWTANPATAPTQTPTVTPTQPPVATPTTPTTPTAPTQPTVPPPVTPTQPPANSNSSTPTQPPAGTNSSTPISNSSIPDNST